MTDEESSFHEHIDLINGTTEDGATIMPEYKVNFKKPLKLISKNY